MFADTTDDDAGLPRLLVLRVWARPDGLRAVVREPGLQCTEVFTDALALCRHVVGAENFERLVGGHGLALRAPPATSARTPEAQAARGDAVAPLAAPDDPHGRAALRHAMRCWQLGMHMQMAGAEQAAPASADDRRAGARARVLQLRAWAEGEAEAGRHALAAGFPVPPMEVDRSQAVHLHLHDACFAHLLGQHEAAEHQLDAAMAMADPGDPMQAWHLFSVRAWRALETRQWHAAEEAARQAQNAASGAGADGLPAQAMSLFIAGQAMLAAGRSAGPACEALQWHAEAGSNPRAAWCVQWLLAADALRADGCGAGDGIAAPLSHALSAQHALGGGLWFGLHHATAARLAACALRHGVEPEAATALVQCHRLMPPPEADQHWPWAVRLQGHGAQQIEIHGRPRTARGKVQRRPLDLLDLLVALGGRAPAAQLADRLWPAAEGDRAMAALEIALRRLRKLLGRTDAVLRSGGALSINRQLVWVEALELSPPGHRPPASVPGADMSLRFVPTAVDSDGASVGNPSLAAGDHGHSRQRPAEGPQANPDGPPRGLP
jgi:hypothetical protein